MRFNMKKIMLVAVLGLLLSNAYADGAVEAAKHVHPTDSTQLGKLSLKDAKVEPYMLAQGTLQGGNGFGDNYVNQPTTNKRCAPRTMPVLDTSVKGIQVYIGYGIKGVENNLKFNYANYHIVGSVTAPTAGTVNPNYVVVNWQLWCQPVA